MNWLSRFRNLDALGILGMNYRNTRCILDLNPRSQYPLVDGKRKMSDLCGQIGVPTPEIYGIISSHSALRRLSQVLGDRQDFVIKPNRGAAGRGILVISAREGDAFVRHNGQRISATDISQHASAIISGLFSLGGQPDEALIQQRIVPHAAFEKISYQGIGDIRVLVYKRVPIMAMLRLPTRVSGGRANLHQGGIGVGVDLSTGKAIRAIIRNRLIEKHPDTGAAIMGFEIPSWKDILDMSRKVSNAVALGYLGVDIVLDEHRGPLLLEANARPGLAIQIANGRGLIPLMKEVDLQQHSVVADQASNLNKT